jgi:hypothetical protein
MLAEIADKHGLRDELDQRALANQDRAIGEAIESWHGPKLKGCPALSTDALGTRCRGHLAVQSTRPSGVVDAGIAARLELEDRGLAGELYVIECGVSSTSAAGAVASRSPGSRFTTSTATRGTTSGPT